MKKSMKMVSVMMSAVMAMSAMSALAAGTYAEELPADPATTITETTDTDTETTDTGDMGWETTDSSDSGYESNYDPSIEHGYIPVVVSTDGINGRLKSISIVLDYEFTAKANSAEVRGILYAHPKTKCTYDENGNVTLHVNEKKTFNTDDEVTFNVPANVDMQRFSIKASYCSHITGDHDLFKYYLANSHIDGSVNDIAINFDAQTYFFSYTVTGEVYVNDALVIAKKS